MKDCLFFVADKNIESFLKGFLNRKNFHLSLKCSAFVVDPEQDIKVAVGKNDPGLFTYAKDLIQPLKHIYNHVVIIIDSDWEGSPGPRNIQNKVTKDLVGLGWKREDVLVVVAEPEIDKWLWTPTLHTATALGWDNFVDLKNYLIKKGYWVNDLLKPNRPKEAAEAAARKKGKARSSSIYQKVASKVSLKNCSDETLLSLITRIRQWFPPN